MGDEDEMGDDGAPRLSAQRISNLDVDARDVSGFDDDHAAALLRVRAALKDYSVDQFLAERRGDWAE